ncbi:MAG: ATP-dependent DNA helicase [Saprospiraceae bacterium]
MSTTIQHYNEAFQQELERLNPAQREAVEQIEGPVLVIAGPGTGKTHILASRIGRILMATDTQPHNILCLTFTDAGVQAMRKRLLQLIGPEAHRVHVYTFHSFCNNIIQSNLERFGRRDLEPLSDLERVDIIRRIIDELPHRHILKQIRGDAYFYEGHLDGLFQTMKKENWSADFIIKKIEEYLADLPNREEFIYKRKQGEFKKGDLKKAKIEEEEHRMEKLRQAVKLFSRYKELMQEMRRYDYSDMILWVLDAFEKHPALLRQYQEQYLYFLVDEYQDTNGAQNEVLNKLVEYWDNPNVFIVGDDDQSIYEFQGARLKNITEFYAKYQQDIKLVILEDNYRSSQNILDTSRSLIGQNKIRAINTIKSLGLEKILNAKNIAVAKSAILPEVVEYPDRLHEEVDIVGQLEKLIAEKFPMDEVAIIFSKHRQSERLVELLGKKNIPYATRRSVNILDLPLIQNLRLLLEYFNAEFHKAYSGEHLLFRIMHFDFFKIIPHDLAKFSTALAKQNNNKESFYWRDKLKDSSFLKKCDLENTESFLHFSAFIEMMIGAYINCSVSAFVEKTINRSGLLRNMIEQTTSDNNAGLAIPNPSSTAIEVLFTFTNFIKKEADRNPRLSLNRLLDLFKSMDANRIQLPVSSGQSTGINGTAAVNLLTAHSSKGLEFRIVFLLDCVKDNWEPGGRGGNFQFSFPDTLTLSGEEDAEEARRRLFYVAMTRAKETLHISYAAKNDNDKELQRAVFLDEILFPKNNTQKVIEIKQKEATAADLFEAQKILLLENKPSVQPHDSEAIQEILENFTLSVSSLNKFLRCPLSFYYENILRVPVMASEAAYFGIAFHDALCLGFEKMLTSKPKAFPTERGFVKIFKTELEKHQAFFSKKEYERRMDLGSQYMEEYVRSNFKNWTKNVWVEKEFKNVEIEGVPVTGVIDRIDFLDQQTVHIVDYKTGSHKTEKVKRPTEKDPHGGIYWRQLVFYKLLFENWRNNPRRVMSAEISYLEPDLKKGDFPEHKITFEVEDVNTVKTLIKETYGKIMRQEFYDGCGEDNCQWCRFLKNQGQVDSFSEKEIEELDD